MTANLPVVFDPRAEDDAEAQCIIGNMYQLRIGIEPSDTSCSEAVKWYIKSAEQGYGVASNNLGEIFRAGSCGVAADRTKAEKWYRKAREQEFLHTRCNFTHSS